jgi:hypothetical protein
MSSPLFDVPSSDFVVPGRHHMSEFMQHYEEEHEQSEC